jgi:3-oxoacid CoA-transferase B subunit
MPWDAAEIATEVAKDIEDDWVVNLGIGMPTLVAERLYGRPILVHAENGILGVGPPPPAEEVDLDLIDPSKSPVTVVPGAAYMDSLTSFAIIRGGHLDLAVMGAFQVSANGDLANWQLPGRKVGGIGGAADLVAGARRFWVMTTHCSKDGVSKLVTRCTYSLTASSVVQRVYTDIAVLDIVDGAMQVLRLAPGVSREDVIRQTEATVRFTD